MVGRQESEVKEKGTARADEADRTEGYEFIFKGIKGCSIGRSCLSCMG